MLGFAFIFNGEMKYLLINIVWYENYFKAGVLPNKFGKYL